MSEWSEVTVARFAASLRKRRRELNLSAQQLADRTKEMGHPINRSSIAGWENGTRSDRLLLGDAIILAAALNIPLGTLLYPELPDGEVEVWPGVPVTSYAATQALAGGIFIDREGNEAFRPTVDGLLALTDVGEELESGGELARLSSELESLRDLCDGLKSDTDKAFERGDVDDAQRLQRQLVMSQGRMGKVVEEIRALGGVVNDG